MTRLSRTWIKIDINSLVHLGTQAVMGESRSRGQDIARFWAVNAANDAREIMVLEALLEQG